MDAIELRPLSLGELLDRAFSLYRRNFGLFVGIMAIPAALAVPISLLFRSRNAGTVGAAPSAVNIVSLVLVLLAFVTFFSSLVMGAATFAVSQSYLGEAATVRDSYRKLRGKIWRIWGAVVIGGLRVIGMMLLIAIGAGIIGLIFAAILGVLARSGPRQILGGIAIAGMVLIYLAAFVLGAVWGLRYSVSIPALLLENLGARASLRRSVQLTQRRRWHIFVAVLLATVITYVGILVFQGPFFVTMIFAQRAGQVPSWMPFASAVSGAVGSALTGPVLIIVLVLLYYDTRIRKEAFDLQFMMSSLDRPAPAQSTPSVA